jgi:hypothetical protein
MACDSEKRAEANQKNIEPFETGFKYLIFVDWKRI